MLKCDATCFLALQGDTFLIFRQNCLNKMDSEIYCYIRSGFKVVILSNNKY